MHCWSYGLETPLAQHDVNRVVVYTIRSKSEQQHKDHKTHARPPTARALLTRRLSSLFYLLTGFFWISTYYAQILEKWAAMMMMMMMMYILKRVQAPRDSDLKHTLYDYDQPSRTNFHFGSSIGSRWISNILYLKRFMRIYLFDRLDCLDYTVSL